MSCQTLVKYILEYEIFQNLRLLVITESNQVITFAEDFMYYIRQSVLFGGNFYPSLLKMFLQNLFFS